MIGSIRQKVRQIPDAVKLRTAILLALVVTGIAVVHFTPLKAYVGREFLVEFVSKVRSIWWTPLLLIGLYAALSLFALPTGPLLVGGAVFGAFYGTLYNLTGLLCGAVLSFFLAKYLGRDTVLQLTGERMRRAEAFFARNGFWPLVQTRFMPLPFAVVNFGSGLTGIASARFLTATVVGLAPSTLIHTYFIAELLAAEAIERTVLLTLYVLSFILFNLLISFLWVPKWRH
jgi:uncharacterized membrane protein YdjX (TVP38/TMEM64 family)